tara:strand:- start:3710 stop:4072 length:363 start_codon:yes stop_codon:yes gene_type:complete
MGTDFADKVANSPSHKKCRDKARVELGTADLLTQPDHMTYAYRARALQQGNVLVGTDVVVCLEGAHEDPQLVALVEGRKVAEFISPPEQLINAVRESTGEAAGHVIRASNRTPIVEICVT